MTNTYAKAYTEVLAILSYFSKEEYSKIPNEKIEFFKSNQDKSYNYTINPEIDLSEQYISKEANAILVSLFRDYFATEKQKLILKNLLDKNQLKLEEAKRKKYNPNNIFNNNKNDIKDNTDKKQEIDLIEIKDDEKWYKKVLKFFIKILKR